jgi:hypothetical protein
MRIDFFSTYFEIGIKTEHPIKSPFYGIEKVILCFVDHETRDNSCKWPTWRTVLFSYMFIQNLYMFRALVFSSSGELIVSVRHPVYVTLCSWRTGMQVWVPPKPAYQTVTYIGWHIPDFVLILLILLMMRTWMLETCRDFE